MILLIQALKGNVVVRNLFFVFLVKMSNAVLYDYMLIIQNKEASELNSVINMALWIQPWFLGFTSV